VRRDPAKEVWEVRCRRAGEHGKCGLSPAVGARDKGAQDEVQIQGKTGSTPLD
jgi:hypothetical protein